MGKLESIIEALGYAIEQKWSTEAGDDIANWFIRDHGDEIMTILLGIKHGTQVAKKEVEDGGG